jgi:hypothetical protein
VTYLRAVVGTVNVTVAALELDDIGRIGLLIWVRRWSERDCCNSGLGTPRDRDSDETHFPSPVPLPHKTTYGIIKRHRGSTDIPFVHSGDDGIVKLTCLTRLGKNDEEEEGRNQQHITSTAAHGHSKRESHQQEEDL